MNTSITAKNRILSFGLALAVLLAMVFVVPGPVEVAAALPQNDNSAMGQPYDGIDFETLVAQGFYYGTYEHATKLSNTTDGTVEETEGDDTPILWRVMGEEESSHLTLLSEYVLDSSVFNPTTSDGHVYNGSTVQQLMGTMASEIFQGQESAYVNDSITVKTRMHNWTNSAELTTGPDNTPYPKEITGQTLYLPWGKYNDNPVYWDAGADTNDLLSASYSGNAATLKNGTSVYWWLCSPHSPYSHDALCVYPDGSVNYYRVDSSFGVRPAFQLNPSSIIFTSKIDDDADETGGETQSNNYYSHIAARGGDANFKLTIVNDGIGTLTGVPSNSTNVSLDNSTSSFWLTNLAPTLSGSGDYTVNYKIVGTNSGNREIMGYGFTPADDSTHLEIGTSDLGDGSYIVYVWLQKNNEINSHEGTPPQYFTLKVDSIGSPYGIDLTPSGTHDFGTAPEGYDPITAQTVQITTTNVTTYDVRLEGDDADKFEMSAVTSDQFTIKPQDGLMEGIYKATVIVAGNYAAPQTLEVEFEVTAGLTLTASSLPNGTVGTAYNNVDISGDATGGTAFYTFALDSGSLPDGLTLNTNGTITGTPTGNAVGNHTFDVVVTDSTLPTNLTATATYTITIVEAASDSKEITGFTIPNQVGGTIIDDAAETITLTMPYGTNVTSLAPSITHTGQSVDPADGVAQDFTSPVTYTVTVTVASSTGTAPSVSTDTLIVQKNSNETFTISLGSGTDAATGADIVSGDTTIATATPTNLTTDGAVAVHGEAEGTATITVTWNGGPSDAQTETVNVEVTGGGGSTSPATLSIGYMPDDTVEEGQDYYYYKSITVDYQNGTATSLNYSANGLRVTTLGYSGTITGQPTETGTFTVNVSVSDGQGARDTRSYTLTVNPPSGSPQEDLILDPPDSDTVNLGEQYVKTLSVTYTGSGTLSYTIDGLPKGVRYNRSTGAISGRPTEAGTFSIDIEVTDGTLTEYGDYELEVVDNSGNGNGGGSTGATTSNSSRSGSGSSNVRTEPKTTLPATAFSWDGNTTLTIDHDSITPLGLLTVQWDGTALTRGEDYAVYQGSVVVRFAEDFIAARGTGDHTVRVEFLNHTGEVTVTVGDTALSGETDATADDADHPDNATHNPNTGGDGGGSTGTNDNPNTGDGRGVWPALLLDGISAAALVKLRYRPRLRAKAK